MITFEHIQVAYPNTQQHALKDISLTIMQGETLVLLGGSGAGKSTILKAILQLLPLTAGRILLEGRDITTYDPIELGRQIGMVFQGNALFPHMSVEKNIGLMLKLGGISPKVVRRRVEELLELVRLPPQEFAARYPHQLSGGQQQRVSVARALVCNPSYLLMDEPFGALDAITRRGLQEELKSLRCALGITIVFVTHDIMEAVSLGDRLAVMDQGTLLQTGTVRELMEHPTHDIVRALVGTPLAKLETFVADSVR